MILCVSANAAIDKTVIIEHFHLHGIFRPSFELILPGGKACNAARVFKAFGKQALVTGWVGGYAGGYIEAALQAEGIETAFVHTGVESRTCLSVVDPLNHTLTEIYEQGRPVAEAELRAFYDQFPSLLARVEMVALSGSLPPGVPDDFYGVLARMAREAGVRAMLDASGKALRSGFQTGLPWMLKCNQSELGDLTGAPVEGDDAVERAVMELADAHGILVIITRGAEGAVAANGYSAYGCRLWRVRAPRIQAVSAVGSGDAFLAGLASAVLDGRPFEEALRLAAAAGAANALQLGAGRLSAEDVTRLLAEVQVEGRG